MIHDTKRCLVCGTLFARNMKTKSRAWRERKFCSRRCAIKKRFENNKCDSAEALIQQVSMIYPDETWLPVAGFEHVYAVSDQGSVFSVNISRKMRCTKYTKYGHTAVCLNRWTQAVHVLVLNAFCGPRPDGHECRHKNGIPWDNRLTNLEWSTRSTNTLDMKWHRGHPVWKLSPTNVTEIRRLLKSGLRRTEIAKHFSVSRNAIDCLARGARHTDVPC